MNKYRKNILDAYRMDETQCINELLEQAVLSPDMLNHIEANAKWLIEEVRRQRLHQGGLDAFLYQYDLSSDEGIALMCLAEAMLRIPDSETVDKLIQDKITSVDWAVHQGKSESFFVNATTWGLMLTGKIMAPAESSGFGKILKKIITRTSEPIIRQAVKQAMKILGEQFVMGRTIQEAMKRAKSYEKRGYRYSYDMLGEAARTAEDAERYLNAYQEAIKAIGGTNQGAGISIKLSALHPRYEFAKRERVLKELVPRVKALAFQAKDARIGFTIDAEEAERLDISLDVIEAVFSDPLLEGWEGFGVVIQAYQKRAIPVIDWAIALARQYKRRLAVRLVKGAYWDSEIKISQTQGLEGYPVFTRKLATDVSYLACAKKILSATDALYPQFATHNAYSVAAIVEMAAGYRDFEFQCLHGMGYTLYDKIVEGHWKIPCRVYAPVGDHEDLLAYLVRRLLENGANTSFVNRIIDEKIPLQHLVTNPIEELRNKPFPHPRIPLPKDLFGNVRPNSRGLDLTNTVVVEALLADMQPVFTADWNTLSQNTSEEVEAALASAHQASDTWANTPVAERAAILERAAKLLDEQRPLLMAMLIREGGKTIPDALSEVREAIDYCYYYASQAKIQLEKPQILVGPTGESNQFEFHGRGVIACISPWNFPLAIFMGQILAALAAGNTVIAKPAQQTPRIALEAVRLLHEAGIPRDVLHCVVGEGRRIGGQLVEDIRVQGYLFTGSTETARGINQTLAHRAGPIVPFIAETGGQNAMIVDSSALPEQVVVDVITSAFGSAGQRCSCLRVLFIQEDVAPKMIKMLQGAMAELQLGDPSLLSTDIGPVIDENAKTMLEQHKARMLEENQVLLYEVPFSKPSFFAPCLFEIDSLSRLPQEIFGPILHVIRYPADQLEQVIEQINHTGYGLTLGIQSRIQETISFIQKRVKVGNIYVNRNMIGAVVGVQPFGGEGLSGTGPKAGGPEYLKRLCVERTVCINTTAVGGNASLLSLED